MVEYHHGAFFGHGYFAKELFRYDPGEDVYVRPGGATLYPRYEGKVRDNKKIEYCDRAACKGCALKPRCTGNTYRRISRLENEAVLDRMAARLDARPAATEEDSAPRHGRGRARGGKGDKKRERRPERREKPAEVLEVAQEAAPVEVEAKHERKQAIQTENHDRKKQAPAHEGGRDNRPNRHRRDHDDDNNVVGFGDDVPAFMKIAARVLESSAHSIVVEWQVLRSRKF